MGWGRPGRLTSGETGGDNGSFNHATTHDCRDRACDDGTPHPERPGHARTHDRRTHSRAGGREGRKYTSCKKLNVRFPHGVGRSGAHDKVRTGKPVTNVTRTLAWYMANASRLDRDHDGIAYEKH